MSTTVVKYIGNIYLSNDCVLKVSSETQNYVFGFNVETEEPVKVLKKTLIKLPPSLLSIIRSHRVQLLIAESIVVAQTKKRVSAATIAPIMNLSERSLYRIMKEEDLYIGKYENTLNRRK